MMKTTKRLLCCALAASTLISTSVFAASWQDSLSSAASELSKQSSGSQSSSSLSSLTSLLNGSNQSLTSSSMGRSAPEQKQDTNYIDGIQGLLNAKDGQQLDLNTIGNSSLAKQVKTKACDLVLKQGMNFIS